MGTFDDLLASIAVEYGLVLDLASADPGHELEPRVPVFVRFTDQRFSGRESARESVWGWFSSVGGDGATDRVAAARALSATGWPEALAWLARVGDERGNPAGPAALEGARLACERGSVPAAWSSPAGLDRILARADALADAGDVQRADAWLRALLRFPRRSADGTDLLLSLLREADPARPNRCATRLAVAAAWRVHAPELERLTARILADPSSPTALARTALAARAASGSSGADLTPVVLAAPAALLADLEDRELALSLAAQLRRANVVFEPGFVAPARWPGPARAAWLLAVGPARADQRLAEAAGDEALWRALEVTLRKGLIDRRLAGELAGVEALIDGATGLVTEPGARRRLDLLALACGIAGETVAARLAPSILNDPAVPPHLLAALIDSRQAKAALQPLLGRWTQLLQLERQGAQARGRAELVEALADAYRAFQAQGDDRSADLLRRAVLTGLRQGQVPAWAMPIFSGRWPLPAGLRAQDPRPRFPRVPVPTSDPDSRVAPESDR